MTEVLSIYYNKGWTLSKPHPNNGGIAIRTDDHWELYNCIVGCVNNLWLYNCIISDESPEASPEILNEAYTEYKREEKLKRIINETNGCPF